MLHGKEPAPCRNRGPCSMGWAESFLDTLKENDVRLVTYVPDNVLTPLIKGVNADNYFISVGTTREDEAIGMVAGSWMAGLRGCVMMQTSGFGTLPNALASLSALRHSGNPHRVRARHLGRVQPGANAGVAHHAADTRRHRHDAPHAHRREDHAVRGRR